MAVENDSLDLPAPKKKNFTKQQATFLLAHSTDYDSHSIEVEETTFRRMLGLSEKAE